MKGASSGFVRSAHLPQIAQYFPNYTLFAVKGTVCVINLASLIMNHAISEQQCLWLYVLYAVMFHTLFLLLSPRFFSVPHC